MVEVVSWRSLSQISCNGAKIESGLHVQSRNPGAYCLFPG